MYFLDFLDVPKDHPRREREGVYSAHTYGPPGRRVKLPHPSGWGFFVLIFQLGLTGH